MTFPTPLTLKVRRYEAGAKDGHGNTRSIWAVATPWQVHSIVPGAMDENGQPTRDESSIAYTVIAPAVGPLPTERDVVVVDEVEYQVNGRPRDFSKAAPWAFSGPPATVELKRVEG